MQQNHKDRKHSKFSASGAERWEACPGSVELSEGQPDRDSPWAIEGTEAHEVLEALLLRDRDLKRVPDDLKKRPREMFTHGESACDFIVGMAARDRAELMVETRIHLDFIHPEMFGTFDAGVIEHFGTLNVFDYKYGAGHAVSAANNLQMAFYGIGLAHKYHWNFKRIRMWIIQPRIRGYDGPTFWELPTRELQTTWVDRFKRAVERVESEPETYVEGSHCHWCKAKRVCPLKVEAKIEKAKSIFTPITKGATTNGIEKEGIKSEADWRKEKDRARRH